MVTSQQSSIELFRSLRTQISANGLSAFKVFKTKDPGNSQDSQSVNTRHNRRCTDNQLDTVCSKG